jgi:hypothetical protein
MAADVHSAPRSMRVIALLLARCSHLIACHDTIRLPSTRVGAAIRGDADLAACGR